MTIQDIFSVRGKTAIVTGGASGIGLAIVEALAENGAAVAIIDSNPDRLAAESQRLKALGLVVHAFEADVSDQQSIVTAIAASIAALGSLDIVFANAGVTGGYGPASSIDTSGALENLDLAVWNKTIDINLTGVLYTLKAVIPALKQSKAGKIIVTASIAGLRANASIGYPYTASKTALVNVIKELALELAEFDIRVNGLAPGPFLTNINNGRFHDRANAVAAAATVPLKRLAQPAEIKGLALLLASSASSYITGAVIPIDGGAIAGS
jgi:NAD(P)-dependent dehydrogenase (short-subunit alcohol dehydrogenase family)